MRLKHVRILLAIISFAIITFFFIDFAGLFPQEYFTLAKIQIVPALLSGSLIIVGVLLLLTLVLGRIYCSIICPFGIFQDIVTWIRKRFKPKMKYKYSKEKKFWRFGILALVLVTYFAGLTVVLSVLEPYSAFGRILTNLLRPVYMACNNLVTLVFNHFGNYTFYNAEIFIQSISALVISVITLLIVIYMSVRYGRTWCNTICPVGTVMGYLSKISFLKIHIDENTCNSCGKCEKSCKSSCIDSKNNKIDYSRCVVCYDCIPTCKTKSISYKFSLTQGKKADPKTNIKDASKRRFLGTLAATTLVAPVASIAQTVSNIKPHTSYKKEYPLSPPGSGSIEHLLEKCTACHLCIAKCPSKVLKPAFMEYGLGGIMQPRMYFDNGFCNYDCTICSTVCPNDALIDLTMEQKHSLQMGRVIFVLDNCVVYTDGTRCGACSEHCPTQAVRMVPYKNGLTIPQTDPDICVGCGGCEYICPAVPVKAIYVEGNPVHLKAKPFVEEAKKEVQIDGFGF